MKVEKVEVYDLKKITLSLSDMEVREVPNTKSKRYRPDQIKLTFFSLGQGWDVGLSPVAAGPTIKADGKEGKGRAEEMFFSSSHYPDWVVELLQRYWPEPSP